MSAACDLTLAGYGPHPERTLTWRRFWYAWLHSYMASAREKRESQTFQMWTVFLQVNPQGAQQKWRELEADNAEADEAMLLALHEHLPRSIRPLLGIESIGVEVTNDASVLEWYDQRIAEAPPGSHQRAFWEAGKSVQVEQWQQLNGNGSSRPN